MSNRQGKGTASAGFGAGRGRRGGAVVPGSPASSSNDGQKVTPGRKAREKEKAEELRSSPAAVVGTPLGGLSTPARREVERVEREEARRAGARYLEGLLEASDDASRPGTPMPGEDGAGMSMPPDAAAGKVGEGGSVAAEAPGARGELALCPSGGESSAALGASGEVLSLCAEELFSSCTEVESLPEDSGSAGVGPGGGRRKRRRRRVPLPPTAVTWDNLMRRLLGEGNRGKRRCPSLSPQAVDHPILKVAAERMEDWTSGDVLNCAVESGVAVLGEFDGEQPLNARWVRRIVRAYNAVLLVCCNELSDRLVRRGNTEVRLRKRLQVAEAARVGSSAQAEESLWGFRALEEERDALRLALGVKDAELRSLRDLSPPPPGVRRGSCGLPVEPGGVEDRAAGTGVGPLVSPGTCPSGPGGPPPVPAPRGLLPQPRGVEGGTGVPPPSREATKGRRPRTRRRRRRGPAPGDGGSVPGPAECGPLPAVSGVGPRSWAAVASARVAPPPSVGGATGLPLPPAVRVPRTSAVVVTLRAGVSTSEAEVMRTARRAVPLRDIVEGGLVGVRRAATGGLLLEVPGGDRVADLLADRLRGAVGDVARVSRPEASAELRISGLDDSISVEEVASALALSGGCSPDRVRMGRLGRDRSGLSSVWARMPAAAARDVAAAGVLAIGWLAAGVRVLGPRPLQCFGCLEPGHTVGRCPASGPRGLPGTSAAGAGSPLRGGLCYRCGAPGHIARDCAGSPRCLLCERRGRPAGHRMGGLACSTLGEGWRGQRAAPGRGDVSIPPDLARAREGSGMASVSGPP